MNNFWQKLSKPFTVLAPMEGVTDYYFREVVAKYLPKPDVMFTEFTNVDALNSDGFERTIPRFRFTKNQRPIVAQIWGTNPENFEKSAELINKLGFDGIDINMGCPDRAAVKIGAGSALIENKSLVVKIIKAVRKGAHNLPVSVKTRLGVKKVIAEEWITFLLEQKIDALTIHGRTAKELSLVPNNWEKIGKAVEIKNSISPNTILIGNGDIKSLVEANEKAKKYSCDGIMIGRGIFSNPWIFEKEKKTHEVKESIEVLIKHLNLINDVRYTDEVKKFYKMYINNFSGANKLRADLMQTKSIKDALTILKRCDYN